jgi:hypothetical protein
VPTSRTMCIVRLRGVSQARHVPRMFSGITLVQAFERLADSADWTEFNRLPAANDADYWILTLGGRPSSHDMGVLRYRELWAKFAEALRAKLLTGEWVAEGFNAQFGCRPVPIDARLWRVLSIAPGHEEAEGEGFRFVNLAYSEARPAARMGQAAHADLRRQLTQYIENVGRSTGDRLTSGEVRESARRAFEGISISDTLFREAWRAANRPTHMRQTGRPKLKGVEK